MITFFSIPKPFRGHIEVIQRNAIQSWLRLDPKPEIFLFCNDYGTHEVAKEFGIRHIPDVALNEYGTPLVSDVFAQITKIASNNILCYINTDIIIMNNLMHAVSRIQKEKYLLLGKRWDLDVDTPIDFTNPNWEKDLIQHMHGQGELHSHMGVDYYIFPRSLYQNMPPFAVGRTSYDNWLIWRARNLGTQVFDATRVVTCIHQNHARTYTSIGMKTPDGKDDLTAGIEALRNREMAGGATKIYTLLDANWMLTRRFILPAWGFKNIKRRIRLSYLKLRELIFSSYEK